MAKSDDYDGVLSNTKKSKLFCCEWKGYDHGDFLVVESGAEAQKAVVGMIQKLSDL